MITKTKACKNISRLFWSTKCKMYAITQFVANNKKFSLFVPKFHSYIKLLNFVIKSYPSQSRIVQQISFSNLPKWKLIYRNGNAVHATHIGYVSCPTIALPYNFPLLSPMGFILTIIPLTLIIIISLYAFFERPTLLCIYCYISVCAFYGVNMIQPVLISQKLR